MKTSFSQVLQNTVLKILKPLVKILIRHGVSHSTFSDLAKRVYIDVAAKEFTLPNKKQSASRVSVLTGLSRQEVQRVKKLKNLGDGGLEDKYNRATRAITGWTRSAEFNDLNGQPLSLPLIGDLSFASLVRKFCGDIPDKAILDELIRVNSVEMTPTGDVRLLNRAYVPTKGEEEKLEILGTDTSALIQTIDHNMGQNMTPHLQLKVCYDNLPEDFMPKLRALSKEKGQSLLEDLDVWMSGYDRDINPKAKGSGKKKAGVGIYYFEEDLSST